MSRLALEQVTEEQGRRCPRGYAIAATQTAISLGTRVLTSVVMPGALSRVVDLFGERELKEALSSVLKPERLQHNLRALRAGRALIEQ